MELRCNWLCWEFTAIVTYWEYTAAENGSTLLENVEVHYYRTWECIAIVMYWEYTAIETERPLL